MSAVIKMKFIRRLFCRHDYQFDHNLEGDEYHYKDKEEKALYICTKCGKRKLKSCLYVRVY